MRTEVVSDWTLDCTLYCRCLRIKYEDLVLHPAPTISSVLSFLSLPWNSSVLSHHILINQPSGVRVSNMVRSSDQIIQPVHAKALTDKSYYLHLYFAV